MSSPTDDISREAIRRIGRFTGALWLGGSIVMAIVLFNAIAPLRWGDQGLVAGAGPGDYPWEDADPAVVQIVDGTLAVPAGGSVLRLPAAERPTGPIMIASSEAEYVAVSVTPVDEVDFDAAPDDRAWPDSLGRLGDGAPVVIMPAEGDLEVWFRSEDGFIADVGPLVAAPITGGRADGKGEALLSYDGPALAARAIHKGEGIFFVTVYTATGSDGAVIESGDIDTAFAWSPPGPVVIRIESDADDAAWSIELLGDSPTSPVPVPTASPED